MIIMQLQTYMMNSYSINYSIVTNDTSIYSTSLNHTINYLIINMENKDTLNRTFLIMYQSCNRCNIKVSHIVIFFTFAWRRWQYRVCKNIHSNVHENRFAKVSKNL